MKYDLIIIGTGLSGLMAAKTAVEAGQKVLIVGKGTGTLCLFTNTINVLIRPLPDETGTYKMKEILSQWMSEHPAHPYSKAGIQNIEKAFASFISFFPPPYSFQAMSYEHCRIPTKAGTLQPAYLLPAPLTGGTLSHQETKLIVGFKGFKDFYSHYAANQLKGRGITIQLPEPSHPEITTTALARLMEQSFFREEVGREIKKELRGEAWIGFPALLGIHHPIKVKEDLEKIIGAKIFEIPTLPPSIPGIRIYNRFKEWLIQKGASFLAGHAVSKAVLKGKQCQGIEISHPPVTHSYFAERYILATGRFVGGGLTANEHQIFEPIFNLPLAQPPSRENWFKDSFFGDPPHPVHQSGVLVNASFQPVDEKGNLLFENVWVAGTLLANHQCMEEKSKEGIEIVTGYMTAMQTSQRII